MFRSRLLVAFLCTLPAAAMAQHTHGVATLDVAVDDRTVNLRLVASADDVYGFERAPRTDAERATRRAALDALRTAAATLFVFDARVNCVVSSARVTDDPAAGSSHREVVAEYALQCQRTPVGTRLRLDLLTRFPDISSVKATRLSGDEAVVRTLKRGDALDL
jgi:hypothetical protein